MKTLIIALNSKYIHSALAPWYLKAACSDKCGEVRVMEFTINENPEAILSAIHAEEADIAAFSCYIWNIGLVLRIAANLKKLKPGIAIMLGGPEVSYDAIDLMQQHPYIDYVISGEGEKPFPQLLEKLNTYYAGEIPGITYREGGIIVAATAGTVPDMSDIASPYNSEMLSAIKGKIAYYEASRGCPFSCAYCLSSIDEGVRFMPLERVKAELAVLVKAGVRQVKFVDRTFNCNKKRAKEIIGYILQLYEEHINSEGLSDFPVNFHFEAAADLYDEESISLLAKLPKGLIQLEIGIQSLNAGTLQAVNRKTDTKKAFANIKKIMDMENIHLHLDLIAGLPCEGLDSFRESFDRVYGLKPHALQLGFLKLLKGSHIRENSEEHGYVYRDYAPYEVLSNKYINYDELMLLKGIEELLDRFWNSGRFVFSLDYIIRNSFTSAFEFYLSFFRYNNNNGKSIQLVSGKDLTALLLEYAKTQDSVDLKMLRECLKLDYLASDSSGHLPAVLKNDSFSLPGFNDRCHSFLRDQNNVAHFLPLLQGEPAKQVMKHVHFEILALQVVGNSVSRADGSASVYLFDYTRRDEVTGRFKFHIIGEINPFTEVEGFSVHPGL